VWRIIGQARAVSLLQRSLETDSLAHAYLFTGPAHIGKMTLALNLAQALNCDSANPPCGECLSCQKTVAGKHSDLQVIVLNDEMSEENRAKIGVSQIEELQHLASLPPFEGRYKVFIIDGTELLSIGAANRLLKTLEEPEGNVVFILLSTNERLIPTTVVSRCQRIELSPISAKEIETALTRDQAVDTEKARLLARLSKGCPGWAVSAAIDYTLVQQHADELDKLIEVITSDVEERFTYAAQLASQFGQKRGLVYEKFNLWLTWWRDLLFIKVGANDSIVNIDRVDSLAGMAGSFSLAQIRAFMRSIQAAGEQLRQNANASLVLEVLMLDIPDGEKYNEVKSAV